MELNAIQPRDVPAQSASPSGNTTTSANGSGSPQRSSTSAPTTVPESDGVFATIETYRPQNERDDESFGEEFLADAKQQATQREVSLALLHSRLPSNARVSIQFDPGTQETRFLVHDRDSGELLREIPEADLADVLRRGPASGQLVDQEF